MNQTEQKIEGFDVPSHVISEKPESLDVTNAKDALDNLESRPQILYFTDPICSYSWQAEPVLRKLALLYKDSVDFHIFMGGLLKNWDDFAKEEKGPEVLEEMADHWKQAYEELGMPVDGTIMNSDPVQSSYPAGTVYSLVKEISETSAKRVLRMMREELMVFNRNISREDVLTDILDRSNRNGEKIVASLSSDHAKELFQEELALAKELGADVFPTIILINTQGEALRIKGVHPFEDYEKAMDDFFGSDAPQGPLPELASLFDTSRNLFFREIEIIYDLEPEAVEAFVAKNLPEDSYEVREILGSRYLIRK